MGIINEIRVRVSLLKLRKLCDEGKAHLPSFAILEDLMDKHKPILYEITVKPRLVIEPWLSVYSSIFVFPSTLSAFLFYPLKPI